MQDQGYVYIDVRSVPEYEGGHPAGAYNIPLLDSGPRGMVPNPEFLTVAEAFLATHPKVILGCQGGNRSMRAAEALEARGHAGLQEQRAGWGGARNPYGQVVEPGWSAAGLPSAAGPDPERGYAALKK
jgi:rhodanese-related sulfurtransferase